MAVQIPLEMDAVVWLHDYNLPRFGRGKLRRTNRSARRNAATRVHPRAVTAPAAKWPAIQRVND